MRRIRTSQERRPYTASSRRVARSRKSLGRSTAAEPSQHWTSSQAGPASAVSPRRLHGSEFAAAKQGCAQPTVSPYRKNAQGVRMTADSHPGQTPCRLDRHARVHVRDRDFRPAALRTAVPSQESGDAGCIGRHGATRQGSLWTQARRGVRQPAREAQLAQLCVAPTLDPISRSGDPPRRRDGASGAARARQTTVSRWESASNIVGSPFRRESDPAVIHSRAAHRYVARNRVAPLPGNGLRLLRHLTAQCTFATAPLRDMVRPSSSTSRRQARLGRTHVATISSKAA